MPHLRLTRHKNKQFVWLLIDDEHRAEHTSNGYARQQEALWAAHRAHPGLRMHVLYGERDYWLSPQDIEEEVA